MIQNVKFTPGKPFVKEVSASKLNSIVEAITNTPIEVRRLDKTQPSYDYDFHTIKWENPQAGDTFSLGTVFPAAFRIVGFSGKVGEAVVSLKGGGFLNPATGGAGDAPEEYLDQTGDFLVWLGPLPKTTVLQNLSSVSTDRAYVEIESVPSTSAPIEVTLVFSR